MANYYAPIPPLQPSPEASPQDRVRPTAPSSATPLPVRPRRKSVAAAVLLTLFFGPIGLAYASVMGAAVTAMTVVLIGVPIAVFYPPWLYVALGLVTPLCIVWAVGATLAYNARQRHTAGRYWAPPDPPGGYPWRTR